MPKLTGEQQRRLQPKLRMISDGDDVVNAIRSECSPAVALTESRTKRLKVAETRRDDSAPMTLAQLPKLKVPLKPKLKDARVSVFVDAQDPEIVKTFEELRCQCGNLYVGEVSVDNLYKLARIKGVAHVELGESVRIPMPLEGERTRSGPLASKRRVDHSRRHRYGKDVLIGIIDVGGFDFSHPDFMRSGRTRFERIWDQGGRARPSPKGFSFGAEFTKEDLDRAIRTSKQRALRLPPWEIERQSQVSPSSHATHVASIAAGNRGVCRNAKIAGVLIDLPASAFDRRKSFYDSTRIAEAVDYLIGLKDKLKCKALSINISLGTNGHAHDATSAISRWIDARLASQGVAVSVAAGNAGQERGTPENRTGYIMGRIHTEGRIEAAGLSKDIEWIVVGNTIADISENELEIWYGSQDRFSISIKPPGMAWQPRISPGEFLENHELPDGSRLSCYNELYHPANGANYIGIYLSPGLNAAGTVGVRAGTWKIRLHGDQVREGSYHGWIERDDPRNVPRVATKDLWRFPSFFTARTNIDKSSVSSLACGRHVVSVSNLDEGNNRIAVSSSQGPTRDGRFKPEVAAFGTDILAARGFSGDQNLWVTKSGTSMACPYVAGVVGLMLSVDPTLTSAQIGGVIRRTSRPLPGDTYQWQDDAGFGRIDAAACVLEARRVHRKKDLEP